MKYSLNFIISYLRISILGGSLSAIIRGWRVGRREFYRICHETLELSHLNENPELTQIPMVDLKDILRGRSPTISISVAEYEDGRMPYEQALILLSILVVANPAEVLEIGTFMGHTTRAMAENLPHAKIHTIDLPEDYAAGSGESSSLPKDDLHLIRARVVGREFKGQECAKRIRQHFGDTATWDFTQAGHPSFFLIDGSHSYEYCKNDSEKCFQLCQGNGVFLWHDLDESHPGVIKLVSEWRALGRKVVRIRGTPLGYWDGSKVVG